MRCRTGCFCVSQSEELQRSFQVFHLASGIVTNAALMRLRRVRPELLSSVVWPPHPGEEHR